MYRKKLNKRKSNKIFKKGLNVERRNVSNHFTRGGIRL